MRLSAGECRRRAAGADHGVLATLHPERGIDAVPVCFVLEEDVVATPIDAIKPKSGRPLQRVLNLRRDPRATLLAEQWDADDWSRLWWIRLSLRSSTEDEPTVARCEAALRAKYPQYAEARFPALLTFRIVDATGWAAT